MTLIRTAVVAEIIVVLSMFVLVEWFAHAVANQTGNFVPAVLFWLTYLAVRTAISMRKPHTGG